MYDIMWCYPIMWQCTSPCFHCVRLTRKQAAMFTISHTVTRPRTCDRQMRVTGLSTLFFISPPNCPQAKNNPFFFSVSLNWGQHAARTRMPSSSMWHLDINELPESSSPTVVESSSKEERIGQLNFRYGHSDDRTFLSASESHFVCFTSAVHLQRSVTIAIQNRS